MTDPWLVRAARMTPDRHAIVTDRSAISYAQLLERARRVAGALHTRGVGRGDRVALALRGDELVVALHACLLIGAAAVPLDLRLSKAERDRRTADARLLLSELIEDTPADPAPSDADEVATVMYTSGTTAASKEVALTLANWQWNAIGSALALGLDPGERWLCPMPLAHVGGLSIQLRSAIYATTVLLHERFSAEAVLAEVADPRRRVTLVSLVPTMLSRLLDAGLREPPTLRWVLLGGGPIGPALLERARAAGVPVASSYGMTEACSQIATRGWPLFGFELSISGTAPGRADPGATGEVLVRGPAVAAGALSDDGWLHTGDLGSLDERGRLTITGRLADTIISGGENVAPAAVEAVLLEHPGLADAAVVGRPDPEWGEAVVALVVGRPGAEPSEEELRAHCAARLASFAVPKRYELVATLPRSPNGKLLRRELGQKPDPALPGGAVPGATGEN